MDVYMENFSNEDVNRQVLGENLGVSNEGGAGIPPMGRKPQADNNM